MEETIRAAIERAFPERSIFERMKEAAERFKDMTPRERAQRRIDAMNAETNTEDPNEYNCKHCANRGGTYWLEEKNGGFYERFTPCKCMDIRRSIRRLKASGLESVMQDYKLENFKAEAEWQKQMLDKAKRYISEGADKGAWLYIGGQPGSGKSHLCTGVCGKLLYRMGVVYAVWPEVSKRLKAAATDAEEYDRQIMPLLNTELVYIDDLFKPTKDDAGNTRLPTSADVKLAFEIINHRYVKRMPTIISSEWALMEMADQVDEATASRIAERSRDYLVMIERDRAKNMRFAQLG